MKDQNMLQQSYIIFLKEFGSYFRTKLAYFIIAIYAFLSMLTTFYMGNFFLFNNSELFSFFYFQTDTFAVLIPALTMRLWAEERKNGTMELLLTQPLSYTSVVIGKFLSAWVFCLMLLVTTFPFWIYINSIYPLDNLNIMSSYLGCILTTGALCAIGCCVSAFNKTPVVAYLSALFVSWVVVVGNFDFLIQDFNISNGIFIQMIQSLNFIKHYQDMLLGQIGLDNIIYFATLMILPIWINIITIEYKKG